MGSGDPLPPSEVLFACSSWKLRPGAQEYRVSWHVTLGPRCQIPEPWPGQAMPRESRSPTLMCGRQAWIPFTDPGFPPTTQQCLSPISCWELPPRTSFPCPEPGWPKGWRLGCSEGRTPAIPPQQLTTQGPSRYFLFSVGPWCRSFPQKHLQRMPESSQGRPS